MFIYADISISDFALFEPWHNQPIKQFIHYLIVRKLIDNSFYKIR